jgi:type II secretory pathway component PulJ
MSDTYESNNSGYSLLEVLIALTIAMITLMGALQILSFASNVSTRAIVRGELTASARTAATVMKTKIHQASAINIVVDGNNTLRTLSVLQVGERDMDTFTFNSNAPISDRSHNRLMYQRNEVASNLADIRIIQDGSDTIIIEILTDNTITANHDVHVTQRNSNITVEPVFIRFPVNVSGKIIN